MGFRLVSNINKKDIISDMNAAIVSNQLSKRVQQSFPYIYTGKGLLKYVLRRFPDLGKPSRKKCNIFYALGGHQHAEF